MTSKSKKIGECLFYQGDLADNFYILLRGKVAELTMKDNNTIDK